MFGWRPSFRGINRCLRRTPDTSHIDHVILELKLMLLLFSMCTSCRGTGNMVHARLILGSVSTSSPLRLHSGRNVFFLCFSQAVLAASIMLFVLLLLLR